MAIVWEVGMVSSGSVAGDSASWIPARNGCLLSVFALQRVPYGLDADQAIAKDERGDAVLHACVGRVRRPLEKQDVVGEHGRELPPRVRHVADEGSCGPWIVGSGTSSRRSRMSPYSCSHAAFTSRLPLVLIRSSLTAVYPDSGSGTPMGSEAASDPQFGESAMGASPACATGQTREGQIMDWKLELVVIPVSDVDRAKTFYNDKIGFRVDHDRRMSDTLRVVQLTPPGSACAIALGKGITDARPGSVRGLELVVEDIVAARAELVERGVEVSEVQDVRGFLLVFFSDPDGNRWAVQQVVVRD